MRPTTVSAGTNQQASITLRSLSEKKMRGTPIVMVTAYDFPSAQAIEASGAVDLVLAGDTGAEMSLGYASTSRVSLDDMLVMTAAVRRGLRTPLLIGDLPAGSYESSNQQAIHTAFRLVKKGGADVVKLERGGPSVPRAHAIIESGIPVMGHLGLTPQSETALGGRKAQARTAAKATELVKDALALQDAGCFALVLEAVPASIAEAVTARLEIPTIGIGAGPGTDGQVLVWHDLLGLYDRRPRFAKAFAQLKPRITQALTQYTSEVRAHEFPAAEHGYVIDEGDLQRFVEVLGR